MATENRLAGKVSAYQIVCLPKKVEDRGKGVTVTKKRKLGTLLTLEVDGKKFIVPSRACEVILDTEVDPTPDLCIRTMNTLISSHPIGAVREFTEFVVPRGDKKPTKHYELKE